MSMWGILLRQSIPKHGRIFYNLNQQEHVQEKIASATQELEQIRLLVLGDAGVGKSSLVKSLTSGKYEVKKTHGVESVLVDDKWKRADESQTSFNKVCGLFAAKETISHIRQEKKERRPTAHTQYRKLLRQTSEEVDKVCMIKDYEKALLFLVLMCVISACAGILVVVCTEIALFVALEIYYTFKGGAKFQNWRFNLLGMLAGYCLGASLQQVDIIIKGVLPLWFHDAVLAFILLAVVLEIMLYFSIWIYKAHERKWHRLGSFIDNVNVLPFFNSFAHFFISGIVFGLEIRSFSPTTYAILYPATFIIACIFVLILHIRTWKECSVSYTPWYFVVYLTVLVYIPFSQDISSCLFIFCLVDFIIHCFESYKKKSVIFANGDEFELQARHFLQNSSELERASEMISSLKIDILDFAGDEDYYSYHQMFIPGNALYVIVFNLTVFINNPDHDLQRISFWLESVLCKASKTRRSNSVLLVGSHCGSITKTDLRKVDEKLNQGLWYIFQECFICNEVDELIFFPVENMTDDADDKQIILLRNKIVETIGSDCSDYVKDCVPLSWFKVKDAILQHDDKEFQSGKYVLTKTEFQLFVDSALKRSVGTQEVDEMLDYFNSKGVVILLKDKTKEFQSIVINPQHLIQVIIKFVEPILNNNSFAGGKNHNRTYRRHYEFLAKYGLLSKQLLEYVLPNESTLAYQSLLEAFDLICPISDPEPFVRLLQAEEDFVFSHMVPNKLPESKDALGREVNPSVHDEQFFIQFHTFIPQSLFYQVMSQCYLFSQMRYPMCRPVLLRSKALLFASTKQTYIIMLDKKQQRIEVAFQRKDKDLVYMMGLIFNIVERIRKRDYPCLVCHCGPLCPLVKTQLCLGDYKVQGKHHIIDIFPRCQSTPGGLQAIHCGRNDLTEKLKSWIPYSTEDVNFQ